MSRPIGRHRRRGSYERGGEKNAQPTSRSDSLTPARQFNSTYQTVHHCVAGRSTVREEILYKHALLTQPPCFHLLFAGRESLCSASEEKKKINYSGFFTRPPFPLCPSLLFASLGFYSLEQNLQLWPPFTTIFYTVHFRSTCGTNLQV